MAKSTASSRRSAGWTGPARTARGPPDARRRPGSPILDARPALPRRPAMLLHRLALTSRAVA
ncbi:hypothetical protein, partial [Kitasatospora putterlickiae]|uniref:hypothetical protein n=1 Tax=Kitasatospora putterlickiae TaxID=221725 RepID=UPI0031E1E158